jgi:hypothetical protein
MFVFLPSYPARNTHAPYYIVVVCVLSACGMFYTLSYKRKDFRERNY